MPISDELASVYSTAPTDRYYIETLELRHPGFTGEVRYITNQVSGFTWTDTGGDIVFQYAPFATVPPRAEDEAALSLQVAIDNASRQLMDELEKVSEFPTQPIVVTYRIFVSDDPSTVQNDPPLVLDILGVVATHQTISFNAGMTNLRKKPFPAQIYTTILYPGLSR